MPVSPGARFGSYEIAEAIGSGGMGEVYRATDVELKRDVAIKVLPEAFASDPDRLARFRREAETLAALNHPNIAQIYGLEKTDAGTVIVMELVDGPTLADRIAEGPIPADEALGLARQIAGALEAAHGRQIVHRDLKPANVKLRPDGTIKVLDFGIAKVADADAISGGRTPTIVTPAATEAGVILGTAAYMSPEQARGRPVDQRADVWAFGCLLFEMLTGQPAFGGEDVMLTLARVLDRDTDLSSMPGTVSPAVRNAIRLCLEKNPEKRIADIRDVRLALDGAFETELPRAGRDADPTPSRRGPVPYAVGLLIGAALVAAGAALFWPGPPERGRVTRFVVTPSDDAPLANQNGLDIAISPDGRRIAYLAATQRAGEVAIYVRDFDAVEPRLLPGTSETAPRESTNPFFSPDGSWIGYWHEGVGIMRVAVGGGPVVEIVDELAQFRGAAVTHDGTLIYATVDGLFRVSSAGGGTPEPLNLEIDGTPIVFEPVLLPGEQSLLLSLGYPDGRFDIGLLDLATRAVTVLIRDGQGASYVPSGRIVFARGNTLMAAPFDAERLAIDGDAVALSDGVRAPERVAVDYALSASGTLAYVPDTSGDAISSSIVWVDREGRVAERAPIERLREPGSLRLSPDGRRLAVSSGGPPAIWVYDLDGRPPIPIADAGNNLLPVWSPDGRRIAFASNRRGDVELYVVPADGSVVDPEPLRSDHLLAAPKVWTEDGDLIALLPELAAGAPSPTNVDIVAVRADGSGDVRDVVATAVPEFGAALSPNGRWLAYVSERTGRAEIWVKDYPDGVPVRVSASGGGEPVWSRDGAELFYLQDTTLMAVPVGTDEGPFSFDAAEPLFESPFATPVQTPVSTTYDVGPDGRFVMIDARGRSGGAGGSGIVVIENWVEELERLAPAPGGR